MYVKPPQFIETNSTLAEKLFVLPPKINEFHYKAFGAGAAMDIGMRVFAAAAIKRGFDPENMERQQYKEVAMAFHPDKNAPAANEFVMYYMDTAAAEEANQIDDASLAEEYIELEQIISGKDIYFI